MSNNRPIKKFKVKSSLSIARVTGSRDCYKITFCFILCKKYNSSSFYLFLIDLSTKINYSKKKKTVQFFTQKNVINNVELFS